MAFGLSDIMGGIRHFIGGDSGEGDYQAQTAALIDRIHKEWQLPQYDQTPLTPKEYALLNQYAPEVASFVEQRAPQMLPEQVNKGTQAQQQSLEQLGQLAKSGTDEGMRSQLEEANMNADQYLRSNKANALAALSNRGLGSSGATLGADITAGLGAAEQQRKAAVEAASQAAQRKAQAIQALGNLGTQVAGQEQQRGEFNANTQNQYDQLIANRRQQYNNYVAGLHNEANLYNQQQLQQVANMNTGLGNQYNMYNREREDRNKTNSANFANQRLQTEAGLQSGANQQGFQYRQNEANNNTQMFMALAGLGAAAATGSPGAAASRMGGGANQYSPDTGIGNNYTGGGYVADYGAQTGSAIA